MVASLPLIYWTRDNSWVLNLLLDKWVLYAIVIFVSYLMTSRLPMLSGKIGGNADAQTLPRIILLVLSVVSAIFLHWLAVPLIFLFYIIISLAFKNRIA